MSSDASCADLRAGRAAAMSALALRSTSLLLLAGGASALAALWARRGRTLRSRTISASAGIEGRLYAYRNSPGSLQAFESPAQHTSSKFCVYLGGLTDGLLACAYVPGLASCAESAGWALVQPIISSSYAGYGTGSLDRDAEELGVLLRYLVRERGATSFALIGHSTGCQDIVQFMKVADDDVRALVRVAVLQAPVSDREAATLEGSAADRAAMLKKAEAMIKDGRGDEIITLQYGFVPLSASRFASLTGRGGPDDCFSSDFTDAELGDKLGHLGTGGGCRTLFVHSLADEYVPPHVDVPALAARFVAAAGGPSTAEALLVPEASHSLATPPDVAAEHLFPAVDRLLREVK